MVQAVGEGDLVRGGDFEFSDLVAEWSLEGSEPFLHALAVEGGSSRTLQRRGQDELDDVLRLAREDAFHVLGAEGVGTSFDEFADGGFGLHGIASSTHPRDSS